MLEETTVARIAELEDKIRQARHDYYNGVPSVLDEVFDAWLDELAELAADSPAVTDIGAPLPAKSEWQQVKHNILMGSLDKVNTLSELTAWVTGCSPGASGIAFEPLLVTEKLDGISIHVRYVEGAFAQAITRGDGTTGEDITKNVVKMKGVLARLPEKFTGSLRGEIILTKTDHADHFPDKANTRNTAAGTSKRFDGRGCEHLTIMFYRVAEGKDFEVESQQFEWFEKMGFQTPHWFVTAMAPGVKTPHDIWVEYQQDTRSKLDYDIDGLVVSINNIEKQLALGEKDGRPKGAVAFKFAPITRETVLQDILWQVGGTGRVTPVAVFDPVRLLGAEVTNASLYNVKYIRDLGLSIGARIIIARANDVIPRVVSVVVKSPRPLTVPCTCPACGHNVIPEGEYIVCQNEAGCPAQAVGRLQRYIKSLNVLEWGEAVLERMVAAGLVKGVPDLYRLTTEQIAGLDRMGDKSAENLHRTLWAKNPLPVERFLGALSIPNCGSSTFELMMDAGYDTLAKIRAMSYDELVSVKGLGPVKSATLQGWFREQGAVIDEVMALGVQLTDRIRGNLTGLSFCFTGKSTMKRADLEELVTANGGTVKGSVGKGLTYLVSADPSSGSAKAKAAQKNGTRCISEEDFLKMVRP